MRRLTWDGLAISQTHYLPIKDAASSAEGFEELRLLLIDDVFHHVRVFFQLRESFALTDEVTDASWMEMGEEGFSVYNMATQTWKLAICINRKLSKTVFFFYVCETDTLSFLFT